MRRMRKRTNKVTYVNRNEGKTCAQLERELRRLKQDIEYNKRMSDAFYERRQRIIDGEAEITAADIKEDNITPEGYAMCFGKLIKIN